MSVANGSAEAQSRLGRLLGYLEQDPDNLTLMAEAAGAALDERALDRADEMLERYAKHAALPPSLMNLKGLVALQQRRFEEAAGVFAGLLANAPDDPALKLNLAWARAMLEDWEGTDTTLDEAATAASPRAAMLKVQALHHLGRLEEALACGMGFAERFPTDERLHGALSTAAMDTEDYPLARAFAERGGQAPEAMTTLGLLSLDDQKTAQAEALFDRALQASPSDARALLGKGLGRMAEGDPRGAAHYLDRGAQAFGDHLGSWVAAAWAYFVQGDYATSRARFEHALAIDDTFAETHGGLAVLDLVEGRTDDAERRLKIALRLDRNCFSAALAKMMLLSEKGDERAALKVRETALNTPIGADGRTLAQAVAGFSLRRSTKR